MDAAKLKKFMDCLNRPQPIPRIPPEDLRRAQVDAAYKRLARKLHPDLGGSTEMMEDLNLLMAAARVPKS
jgi:hypothetical protein